MEILAQNRKARHDYKLLDTFESGIQLVGTEVKSLRGHHGSITEAFIIEKDGELFLHNAHIPAYKQASLNMGHAPLAQRKLLLHRRQIHKIIGGITRKGMTAIPLKLYLNERGRIKLALALAVGMQKADKRQALKEKAWKREQHQLLKSAQHKD
jgi:SsrA-binding protein